MSRAKNIRIAVNIAFFAALGSSAQAELPTFVAQSTPIVDLRARYEEVDDKSKTRLGQAGTFRARLGFETGRWNNLQLAVDFDQIWRLGGSTFNSTRNGATPYPIIADPAMTALNRLQLTYFSDYDTKITVGRQRILIGNQRFVGNSGWRQHEQTFDSVSAVNTSLKDLTVTYAYLYRVNRIGGPDQPVPSTSVAAAVGQANYLKSNSHIFDAAYTGFGGVRLESYAFLLDLAAPAYAQSTLQNVAASKLSTATYGARADYSGKIGNLSVKLSGEYARQIDYAENPLSFSLDYWLGEASVTYAGLTALAGYENLGGNGIIGFSTPLATLHAFNGWADLFLTTPADGLRDANFNASYVLPFESVALKSIKGTAVYHSFTTDKFDQGIGSEWDIQAELTFVSNTSFLLKYASYQGSNTAFGDFPDKSIFWLQAAYKA